MKTISKYYGPYTRKDGRRHMVLIYSDGTKGSQSYPRYLWEKDIGPIPEGMDVDHKDNDPTNDCIENYQLLSKLDNNRKYKSSAGIAAEMYEGECPECGNVFTKRMKDVRHNNISQGKPGPFCSKVCAGKRNARLCNTKDM